MQQEKELQQTIALLHKHLQVEEGEPLSRSVSLQAGMEELRRLLKAQIAWMLDHQFERLLQAMYRIDVNEQAFRAVLTGAAPVAEALTELVLQRELKKIEIRRLYSSV